jgi:uncharacterized protein (TIGR03084 family)
MTSDLSDLPSTDELSTLRRDLVDEHDALDDIVASLDDEQWQLATPSAGWCVADQIGHLTYFDASAATALLDPDVFLESVQQLIAGATNGDVDAITLESFRKLSSQDQLTAWRHAGNDLAIAAASLRAETRVPWYGPSMSATSFLGARIMETWAHGRDIVDALGAQQPATDRLRHVARLGFLTRKWSYQVRGEDVPSSTLRLELLSPSGETWLWGPEDADDVVRGSAEEFCLVVTQRRHVDDTALTTSEAGYHWLVRAQAFAGTATYGPQPRSTS